MSVKQKIIVGIDFGTTYSGIAWADSTSPKNINLVRQWPGAVGKHDVDKVPSEMIYLPDGSIKWGFQARGGGKLIQYMKLLLDSSQGNNGSDLKSVLGLDRVRAALPANKKPVDAIADYLGALNSHLLEVLAKQFGAGFRSVIDIEYHLTIPAVWSDTAKALTLQAASTAGIGGRDDIIGITEPEAAALYCLTDQYPEKLKVDDTFVVVDCGGGTVDLVSYQVLAREPELQVKEVAVGGGLCGSVFLNWRFEAFIRKRLGPNTVERMIRKGKPFDQMMKDFDENLKRNFNDSDDQEFMDCQVPGLPDNPATRVEDCFLLITRQEMKGVFEPVIEQVLRLIQEQVDSVEAYGHSRVSSILLVGGFGSSPYLYKRVQERFQTIGSGTSRQIEVLQPTNGSWSPVLQGGSSRQFEFLQPTKAGSAVAQSDASPQIEVLQPTNAWSAVARGAVTCGLQRVIIQSRKSRRSYGTSYKTRFVPGVHSEAEKAWCPMVEAFYIYNLVRWYVTKDKEVVNGATISFPFLSFFTPSQTHYRRSWKLLASNSPASEIEDRSIHPNVFEVCVVECDLDPLREFFVKVEHPYGGYHYEISYNVVMHIHSAQLTFGVERDGVNYATTTVTFL